jgi:hypothetical protein
MKKIFLLGLLVTFCLPTFAQVSEMMGFRDYRDIADAYYVKLRENAKFDINDIKGSPFLSEEFQFGNILDNNSMKKVETYLRYDIYNDVFEIQLDTRSDKINTLERTQNFDYYLNDEKFVLIKSNVLNVEHYTSGNGYVVELIPENVNAALYKRYYVELKSGSKALTSYQEDIPPSIRKKEMYIVKINEDYYELEKDRKDVIDAFPDFKDKLKKYIKEKKFKFRGDDREVQNQMVQLVRYYNSL